MKRIILSILMAILAQTAACDEAATNDYQARYSSWSGFYIGATEGSFWSRAKTRTTVDLGGPGGYFFPSTLPVLDQGGSRNLSSQSALGGVQSGYIWRLGPWVLGMEADFIYANLAIRSFNFVTYPCCAPSGFSFEQSIKLHWIATARPRIGVAHDRVLYFLTGGAALGKVNTAFDFADNNSNATAFGSFSHNAAGYALGGRCRSETVESNILPSRLPARVTPSRIGRE